MFSTTTISIAVVGSKWTLTLMILLAYLFAGPRFEISMRRTYDHSTIR